jgi:hypothetical protein
MNNTKLCVKKIIALERKYFVGDTSAKNATIFIVKRKLDYCKTFQWQHL